MVSSLNVYKKKRVDQHDRLIEFTTNCSSEVNQIDVEIICFSSILN
jgi:hypothetical protein